MDNIKELTVKVTYRVSLIDHEIPEKTKEQLVKACDNGDEISVDNSLKYPDAYDWISTNVQERDAMNWDAEIVDIS